MKQITIAILILALASTVLAQKRRAPKPKPKAPAVVVATPTQAATETPKPKRRTPSMTATPEQDMAGVVLGETSRNAAAEQKRLGPLHRTPSASGATVAGDDSAGNGSFDRSRGISHRGRPSAGRGTGQTSYRRTR
ncbi:MAG: hypothetical protein PHQ12_14690 [Chthoniobacteraceae bacterium]|nr:hypothetical protein [Chthoniobacteraceae bacterium]